MTCGQEMLLNNLGTRLRIAELLYLGHITFYEDHAARLLTPELVTMAIERFKNGMIKPLSPKEKKFLYAEV